VNKHTSSIVSSPRAAKRSNPVSPPSEAKPDDSRPAKPSDEGGGEEHLSPDDSRPAQVGNRESAAISPDHQRPLGPRLANAQLNTRQPGRKRPRGPGPGTGGDKVDASFRPDCLSPGSTTEADTALVNVLTALRRYKGESAPYSEPAFLPGQQPALICPLSRRKEITTGCIFHGRNCSHKTSECTDIRSWIAAAKQVQAKETPNTSPAEATPALHVPVVQRQVPSALVSTSGLHLDSGILPKAAPSVTRAPGCDQGVQTEDKPSAVHRSCQAGRPLRLPLVLKPPTRSIGIQDDLRYHVGTAVLPESDTPVPVVTLLSQARERVFAQDIHEPITITRPKKPSLDNPSPTEPVFIDYFDPAEYWPDYDGPTTCLLAEVYEPVKPQVVITEGPFVQGATPPPGCVSYQSREAQREAGFNPTSNHSANALLSQLDDFLEDRDGEANGPEGYYGPLKQRLQKRLRGYLDTTR